MWTKDIKNSMHLEKKCLQLWKRKKAKMGDARLNPMSQKVAKLESSDEETKNNQIVTFFNSASKFSGLSQSGALLLLERLFLLVNQGFLCRVTSRDGLKLYKFGLSNDTSLYLSGHRAYYPTSYDIYIIFLSFNCCGSIGCPALLLDKTPVILEFSSCKIW